MQLPSVLVEMLCQCSEISFYLSFSITVFQYVGNVSLSTVVHVYLVIKSATKSSNYNKVNLLVVSPKPYLAASGVVVVLRLEREIRSCNRRYKVNEKPRKAVGHTCSRNLELIDTAVHKLVRISCDPLVHKLLKCNTYYTY